MAEDAILQRTAFVGLDVHKRTIRVSLMDADGNELANGGIRNTEGDVRSALGGLPGDARLVMESSSVWKDVFFQLRDSMGYDVTLSNPYTTRLIAESKKKTDKVDARVLADMLRGGYIAGCHVPSRERMEGRDLVRYRRMLVLNRIALKNFIHGILLQKRISIPGTPFAAPWTARARGLGDYRIDGNLRLIWAIGDELARLDVRVRDAAGRDPDAVLLMSIPGVGPYTALVIASEIDGIGRFVRPHKLCAYAGLVPSVRSSGESVHYGRITRRGSDILRWVLVECVHSHARYAGDSGVARFYMRLARKRGRGRAAVAAASLMLRIIHSMLRERRRFVMHHGQDNGGGTFVE